MIPPPFVILSKTTPIVVNPNPGSHFSNLVFVAVEVLTLLSPAGNDLKSQIYRYFRSVHVSRVSLVSLVSHVSHVSLYRSQVTDLSIFQICACVTL